MKVDPSSPSILLLLLLLLSLLLLQETCKTNYTFLKPNRLYERRLCSIKHEILNRYTSSYNQYRDSNTHWTMIWEEEEHHIFTNNEMKYKYTFSSSWALHETLIWVYCFSSPRNSASKLCNTRRMLLGKRCGQRELQILPLFICLTKS